MSIQSTTIRRSLVALAIALTALSTSIFLRTGRAHEPITTKVMFNKEVIRILQRNCLACHSPGRIKADIPLTTYEEARPWAKAIKEEVLEKRMTPFQTVKGYGSFQHDYILPQREVDLLVSWIEGGAPRGAEKDYPKAEIEELARGVRWPLGQPDAILQPQIEAKIPAGNTEELRCSHIPTKFKEDRWINSFDFQPGNGAIVQSASFFIDRAGGKSAQLTGACGASDERDGLEALGQWIPGQAVVRLPDGIARLLPAGSRLVMKVRYRNNGEAATDRSRLGLYFAKTQANRALRDVAIRAPQTTAQAQAANSGNFRVKASYTVNEATEAIAIRPLLFPFAKSVEATAIRPDGIIEVLIWTRNYRFDWQPAYFFKKPVALPKGTRIEITVYLDNSEDNPNNPNDPPKPVRLTEPLCELSLTSAALLKQARR